VWGPPESLRSPDTERKMGGRTSLAKEGWERGMFVDVGCRFNHRTKGFPSFLGYDNFPGTGIPGFLS